MPDSDGEDPPRHWVWCPDVPCRAAANFLTSDDLAPRVLVQCDAGHGPYLVLRSTLFEMP